MHVSGTISRFLYQPGTDAPLDDIALLPEDFTTRADHVPRPATPAQQPGLVNTPAFAILPTDFTDDMFQTRRDIQTRKLPTNEYTIPFQPELPSNFTVFDAFELNAWDSAQSTASESNNKVRVQAAPANPGETKTKGKGGGASKGKLKKYGQRAWVLGMQMPYTGEMGPPGGPDGLPPDFTGRQQFSEMWNQDFHRDRPLQLPMDKELLDQRPGRMRIDWETPFQHNMHRRRIPMQDYIVSRVEFGDEQITMDKWFRQLDEPVRTIPTIINVPESVNIQDLDETILIDKYESKHDVMRLIQHPVFVMPPWPFSAPPGDVVEEITLDKWYTRLSEPTRLIPWRQPLIGILDPEPLPDEPLLPTRIPWDVPLGYEFNTLRIQIPPLSVFVDDTGEEEVAPFIDKWGVKPIELIPRPPKMPIALFPFRLERENPEPENVTLDKWYTPLTHNFHKRVPQTPRMDVLVPSGDDEVITLDKWYSNTGFWSWPFYALRATTGAEGQSIDQTVNTAPWIPLHSMDPEPILNIPGVTYEYWFTGLELPVQLFTSPEENDELFLRLYLPLQNFPVTPSGPKPCEQPRKRVSEKRIVMCGSKFVK